MPIRCAHCSSDVINTLHLTGMIPIPSPELKDRRSVIAKKVRKEIHDTMEAKVKDEIERAMCRLGNYMSTFT